MPTLLPSRLHAPTPVRWLMLALWALLFAFGLIAATLVTRDTLRSQAEEKAGLQIAAPFMRLGFQQPAACCYVIVTPGAAQPAGLYPEGEISRVDNRTIDPASMTLAEVSVLLDKPEGTEIPITYSYNDYVNAEGRPVEVNVTLRVAEANRTRALAFMQRLPAYVALKNIIFWLGTLAQLLALGVAALIVLKKRRDTVALVLSFALIGLALETPEWNLFSSRFELFKYHEVFNDNWYANLVVIFPYLLFIVPLFIALPAFPDGNYVPRWSVWFALLAPILVFVSTANWQDRPEFGGFALPPILLLGLAAFVLVRYWRTPPGVERQQIKWAAFGVGFGTLAVAISLLLTHVSGANFWYADEGGFWRPGIFVQAGILSTELLLVVGRILIPLGLLMSIMKWRLNDADSAIGRSAGYAMVTLLIGGLWATMTVMINNLLGNALGASGAAGLSTAIAAAVLVPTREKTLKWTEKKFQPALVRLRSLPAKLTPWKHDHDPVDLARGSLAAIVRGVDATTGAIALREGDGWVPVATHEVSEASVIEQLETEQPDLEIFPLRIILDDIGGEIGVLLIGPRGDGARYSSDERKALGLIETPLAEALRATSRRAQRNAEHGGQVAALKARIASLEAGSRPASV